MQQLEQDSQLIQLHEDWTINAFQGDLVRPRYVLQSRRHVLSISELSDHELRSMADTISRVIEVLESEPQVERVYLETYNETAPGHLHIHLTPRFSGESHVGPQLTDARFDHWNWSRVWAHLVELAT